MMSRNKKTGAAMLGSRIVEFCELHIGWFVAYSGNQMHSFAEMLYKDHVQLVKKASVETDFLF